MAGFPPLSPQLSSLRPPSRRPCRAPPGQSWSPDRWGGWVGPSSSTARWTPRPGDSPGLTRPTSATATARWWNWTRAAWTPPSSSSPDPPSQTTAATKLIESPHYYTFWNKSLYTPHIWQIRKITSPRVHRRLDFIFHHKVWRKSLICKTKRVKCGQ